MKVLHLNQHFGWYGGIETYLMSLLPRLGEQGIEPLVACAEGDDVWSHAPHRIAELADASQSAAAAAYQAIARIIQREKPQLAHIHNVHNIGAIEACLDRVPTVLTVHDYRYACPASTFFYRRTEEVCQRRCGPGCFTTTLWKRCLTPRPSYALRYYARVRWMVRNSRRFARFIAPSRSAQQRFAAGGFPGERIDVNPYFCPIEPRPQPRTPPPEATLLFLGRIQPNKGYRYFVEALGQLPSSVKGVMVGNATPARQQELHKLAGRVGCGDRLELRSWASRDEVRQLFEQASVFVFPSVWPETLGIVGLESLANGVPVVASDIGGVREWLHDGETGYLAPPKDSAAIAAAVSRLLDHPSEANAMGQAGLKLIRSKFTPDVHIQKLVASYENALTAERN